MRGIKTFNSEFVFTNGGGKPLSNMTMLELLRGMAGNGYTVHGFRSAFSDWARDCTAYARDVIEMALSSYHQGQVRSRLPAWRCLGQAAQAHGCMVELLRSACRDWRKRGGDQRLTACG